MKSFFTNILTILTNKLYVLKLIVESFNTQHIFKLKKYVFSLKSKLSVGDLMYLQVIIIVTTMSNLRRMLLTDKMKDGEK
jgi:hypothetical protein